MVPASTSRLTLDCQIAPKLKVPRGILRTIEAAAEAAFRHLPARYRIACDVTLLITHNHEVKTLNRDYRGLDKPTNVLSFPQFEPRDLASLTTKKGPHSMGDIALAYPYVVVEAKKEHKILINHLQHLMIHGLLHLFGYDHQSATQAHKMESLETKIMASLGLPDPYLVPPSPAGKKQRKVASQRKMTGRSTQ